MKRNEKKFESEAKRANGRLDEDFQSARMCNTFLSADFSAKKEGADRLYSSAILLVSSRIKPLNSQPQLSS